MNNPIIITGGAGIVGFNLVKCLLEKNFTNIQVIDKNIYNLKILNQLFKDIKTHHFDLSKKNGWSHLFVKNAKVIILHAQISSLYWEDFQKNTIDSTRNLIEVLSEKKIDPSNIIFTSSSVVNSVANDFYVRSKTVQEKLISQFSSNILILRPTLMFGLFDRKHLGWLSRFMEKTPLFPIPGNGRYLRQPLFVEDYVNIIVSSLTHKIRGTYDISGQEKISYIDIIKVIKRQKKSKTIIIQIPYVFFFILLKIWALFDRNPPFTVYQLRALVIPETFPSSEWEAIFNVKPTQFEKAAKKTFGNNKFNKIRLKF